MEFLKNLGGFVNKAGFTVKKHSPEILAVAGTIGIVASTIMACKATLKVNDLVDEHNSDMERIKSQEVSEKYTAEDQKHDITVRYAHTAINIAKLYGPAIGLGVLSVGSMLTSNEILRRRNAALIAAYAAIDKGFKEYRQRVVDRFGKEVDQQLKYNLEPGEIEETVTDEKGKTKVVKKKVDVLNGGVSDYARIFTRSNVFWENHDFYVEMWLNQRQAFLNNLLQTKGTLTLNEAYRLLGFHESKAGMVVGWRYDKLNPSGDNYIQFDVKEVYMPNEFGKMENAYVIDFNVDGNIYDLMEDYREGDN